MNLKIKFREVSGLLHLLLNRKKAADYSLVDGPSPYMLFVHQGERFFSRDHFLQIFCIGN